MRKLIFLLMSLQTYNVYAGICKVDETLIASCILTDKNQQVAAFCADNHSDDIRYTFKKNGNTELEVNFNSNNKIKRWLDLGTYTTYLGFNKGSYSYVIGVPEERPKAVAFLDVKKNGKTISSKECNANSFGEKDIKKTSIEDLPDDSVRNSGFRFP